MPGDIPVFLELALSVCALQRSDERVATLVIPDRMTPAMGEIVEQHRLTWSGPLELIPLPRPERWFLHHLRSGSRNHGMQLVAGVQAATSSHVVLHDADLFLLDENLLDDQYRRCRDRALACLGVSPVWDGWYADRGRDLAATWEMIASVAWLRSFSPYEQIGHDGELFGEVHTFDTTLYPQAVTAPELVAHVDREADYVHFNYVISSFRDFQRRGPGYIDNDFRLLLIAVFVELFSKRPKDAGLPSLADMAHGLGVTDKVVCFPSAEDGGEEYRRFRTKLDRALHGPYLSEHGADRAASAIRPFDDFYSYRSSPA